MTSRRPDVMQDRKIPFLIGVFLCSLCLLLGTIGCVVVGPELLRWRDAAAWPRVPAEILSGEIVFVNSVRGGRTVRPRFTWSYEAGGTRHTGEGFDVAGVSMSDPAFAEARLAQYPVGSRTEVLVNPADPAESILQREPASHLIVLFVPPFFLLLGLIGSFFTLTARLGWYGEKTRHPFGRFVRAAFAVFLRPAVMMTFVVLVFVLVGGGLVWWSIAKDNVIGHLLAAFLAYGLWQAARYKPGRGRRRR